MARSTYLSLQRFKSKTKKLFSSLCVAEKIVDAHFQENVIEAIQLGFSFQSVLKDEQKALILLDHFFFSFTANAGMKRPFDLSKHLDRFSISKIDLKKIVASLLYTIYFGDLLLSKHVRQTSRKNLSFFFYQIIAENVSSGTLVKILKKLSLDEIVCLISYCFWNEREGAYLILKAINDLPESNREISQLIEGLEGKNYLPATLQAFLESYPAVHQKRLKELLKELEQDKKHSVSTISQILPRLMVQVVDSPLRVHEYMKSHQKKILLKEDQSDFFKQTLEQFFAHFNANLCTEEKISEFLSIFGLFGHQPPLKFRNVLIAEDQLVEKLTFLLELFDRPDLLAKGKEQEMQNLLIFLYELTYHLYAFHENPELYKQGMDRITFALPTFNKDLSRLAWIPSIILGLRAFCSHLKKKGN